MLCAVRIASQPISFNKVNCLRSAATLIAAPKGPKS